LAAPDAPRTCQFPGSPSCFYEPENDEPDDGASAARGRSEQKPASRVRRSIVTSLSWVKSSITPARWASRRLPRSISSRFARKARSNVHGTRGQSCLSRRFRRYFKGSGDISYSPLQQLCGLECAGGGAGSARARQIFHRALCLVLILMYCSRAAGPQWFVGASQFFGRGFWVGGRPAKRG
jgi:hypothetical protein